MSDLEEREYARIAAIEGSLETWSLAQRALCRKGEHCWSNWISNHSHGDGLNYHWTTQGFMVARDFSIRTRECLICPRRQRMVRKLGDSIPHPNFPGMSTYETLDEKIFDV